MFKDKIKMLSCSQAMRAMILHQGAGYSVPGYANPAGGRFFGAGRIFKAAS